MKHATLLSLLLVIIAYLASPISVYGQDTGYYLKTTNLQARPLIENGWGDRNNMYAWTMETFNGKLYVGSLNIKGGSLGMNLFMFNYRVFTNGAEVHEGTRDEKGNWSWRRVLSGGLSCGQNYGVRKLITVGDYLYGVTANNVRGFDVIRTTGDGSAWETVMSGGFGTKNNISGRGMIQYDGYLYIGTANFVDGAEIWRHSLLENGDLDSDSEWENVVRGGNGDVDNKWFSDMVEYNGYIYVGTLNYGDDVGADLVRSSNGVDWEYVIREGNGIGTDKAFMKLYVYKDHLYIGTMNFKEGASLLVSTDVNATEFTHLFTKGNGNEKNVYMWYIQEFKSRLFIGTFNAFGTQEFDLFSHEDPSDYTPFTIETRDGFANNVYGIRSMVVMDDHLIIGGASNNEPAHVWEAEDVSEEYKNHTNIFNKNT